MPPGPQYPPNVSFSGMKTSTTEKCFWGNISTACICSHAMQLIVFCFGNNYSSSLFLALQSLRRFLLSNLCPDEPLTRIKCSDILDTCQRGGTFNVYTSVALRSVSDASLLYICWCIQTLRAISVSNTAVYPKPQ